MEANGLILHLQRLSTEDGPGIRTTVFFKGCPMHCAWCHNPESISMDPQVQWLESRCIGCDSCIPTCLNGCLRRDGASLVIDRTRCQGCGTCVGECPSGALELLGRRIPVTKLLPELLKDRAYYTASAGGVTLSGGEPALQASFAAELLSQSHANKGTLAGHAHSRRPASRSCVSKQQGCSGAGRLLRARAEPVSCFEANLDQHQHDGHLD